LIVWLEDLPLQNYKEKKEQTTMSSLKGALSEAMKENGSWMTRMKKDHEVQLRTQEDIITMYRKQNEKLEEENKKLKEQNEHLEYWREHEVESPWEAIVMMKEFKDEIKKLKEEKQEYQPKGSQIDPEGLHDYMKQQIDKLKEEVEEWKESCSGYVDTPDELEMWMSASIHEDEEEYSKYMEPLELRDEVKKLKEELKKWMDERLSFGLGLMSVKDTLDEILYGDKDGCPYEHDHEKDQSTNLWDSWKVRIKSIGKLKEGVKHADNYWRCIMDHLSNPDNPDVNFIKPWASEDGLNEEDTEELLNNFGYYPEEEDPTDK
jgi:hypothetical protein